MVTLFPALPLSLTVRLLLDWLFLSSNNNLNANTAHHLGLSRDCEGSAGAHFPKPVFKIFKQGDLGTCFSDDMRLAIESLTACISPSAVSQASRPHL